MKNYTCPYCGKTQPLQDDTDFCIFCGKKTNPQVKKPVMESAFCPKCGKENIVEKGNKFCTHCGYKMPKMKRTKNESPTHKPIHPRLKYALLVFLFVSSLAFIGFGAFFTVSYQDAKTNIENTIAENTEQEEKISHLSFSRDLWEKLYKKNLRDYINTKYYCERCNYYFY